jgi:hypothetical protein
MRTEKGRASSEATKVKNGSVQLIDCLDLQTNPFQEPEYQCPFVEYLGEKQKREERTRKMTRDDEGILLLLVVRRMDVDAHTESRRIMVMVGHAIRTRMVTIPDGDPMMTTTTIGDKVIAMPIASNEMTIQYEG